MKRLLILLILCFYSIISFAQTQYEMSLDALKTYQHADNVLSSVYKLALQQNQENNLLYIKKMKAAQKLWIQFRDAQLEAKFPVSMANKQGTSRSSCYHIYKKYLTEKRTLELKEMIISEEGDVCK